MTKAFFAALCSMFVPGSGQWIFRRWQRGVVLLLAMLAVLGVLGWIALRSTRDLFALLVQPRVLLALLAINAALLLVRLFAVADAYRLGRAAASTTRHSWIGAALVAVLLLATAAPHAAVGYYNYTTYSLLTTVFVDDAAAASPSPAPSVDAVVAALPTATPTTVPSPTAPPPPASDPAVPAPSAATPPPTPTAAPILPPSPPPTPEPTPQPSADPWQATGRLNILLLGGDAGAERTGLRTDTMMVASVDPHTRQAALFGIPRDLKQVPLPDPAARYFRCRCWPERLNALYEYGEKHPDLFPASDNPGASALQATIGKLLGLQIDHYALVDMGGFVDVIDAVGGVTVTIPEPMQVRISPPNEGEAWQTYNIPAGHQHLDGRTALAYARNRSDSNDFVRMQRQRCLLTSIAQEADPANLVRAFPQLAQVTKERVVTNIPLSMLPDLMTLATEIDAGAIVQEGFTPPRYAAGFTDDEYPNPIPNVPLIRRTVRRIIEQGTAGSGSSTSGIATASESCGWTQ